MPEDDDFLDGYEPAPPGTFLDLNGTAVGDIQRLGKFLREEFHDGTRSRNTRSTRPFCACAS